MALVMKQLAEPESTRARILSLFRVYDTHKEGLSYWNVFLGYLVLCSENPRMPVPSPVAKWERTTVQQFMVSPVAIGAKALLLEPGHV